MIHNINNIDNKNFNSEDNNPKTLEKAMQLVGLSRTPSNNDIPTKEETNIKDDNEKAESSSVDLEKK